LRFKATIVPALALREGKHASLTRKHGFFFKDARKRILGSSGQLFA
jgi:hypothetical protein